MASYFDLDDIFKNLEAMMRKLRDGSSIEEALKSGELKGEWDVEQIDEPEVKGYVIRGNFQSDQPLEPLDPLEPPDPQRRLPRPERPFRIPEETQEAREPLVDIFDGEDEVKIYAELPGEAKDDILLNVTEGAVEIKARNFYKTIEVPRNIEAGKASSRYRNSVLEVTLPKTKPHRGDEKHRITVE